MIRILIADDHAIFRAGLKKCIEEEADMEVGGEAETGARAIELVREGEWGLVLLDISMPDQNGVDTLKRLKQIKPGLPVLILSAFSEEQYAVNLLRAGAAGYLSKESAAEELIAAARAVARGQRYVSPALAQILASDVGERTDGRPLHAGLSTREFQVFCKLAAGVPVSAAAEQLNLSVKTVSTYRSRILEKMRLRTNADLTYYAIKNHLID